MRLYWSPRSPFVRKVSIFAAETGTDALIERVPQSIAQPGINAEVLAANPVGKIPVLILDDGTALTDSRVICEYLDTLHAGPRLYPGGEARWAALRWQALGDGLLEQLLLWRNESLRADGERSRAYLDGYARRFMTGFGRLEGESAALADAPFSIGQIAIGCMLGFADFRFAHLGWREGRPGLAQWYDAFAQRGAVRANPADPESG